MKVLVTGANGFVGRTVCRRFRERGHTPLAAVRGATNLPGEIVVVSDIGETGWCAALRDCDTVVHLAARTHAMLKQNTAVDSRAAYWAANVDLTLRLGRQAAVAGVRRFVFMSSVKVHGESTPVDVPFTEESALIPQDDYGRSKLEAEQGLRRIAAQTDLDLVVIRSPLVYGPGVRANFAALARVAAAGYPLPLGRVIANRRSLVGLENLANFIVTCCEHPAAADQTFLVSDGEDVSTAELLRRISAACGKKVRLLPVPVSWLRWTARALGRPAAAQRLLDSLVVDVSKARRLLSWSPPVSMEEQLARMALRDAHT